MGGVFNEPPGQTPSTSLVVFDITLLTFKETEMNKSTLSILMAALMAASGFAAAQSAPAMPGTMGGSGPSAAPTGAPGNMPSARADVKADAVNSKAAGITRASGCRPAQSGGGF
jgi:hypothetical protein